MSLSFVGAKAEICLTQGERSRFSVGCDSHPADEVLSRAEIDNKLAVPIR
ncbi:Uncharacterised protein [Yersinia mollaretii]|nr:Uncharacterised protein [Yersinia mollaretii]CQH05259.1 Uncharacterised protein [Yersinia mollaretii]